MEYIGDVIYDYADGLYINMTNRCPCRCSFCIRNLTDSLGNADSLWLRREPDLEEILEMIRETDLTPYNEAVFCGYGEPTMALDKLIAVSEYMRSKYPAHLDRDGKPCPGKLHAGICWSVLREGHVYQP